MGLVSMVFGGNGLVIVRQQGSRGDIFSVARRHHRNNVLQIVIARLTEYPEESSEGKG